MIICHMFFFEDLTYGLELPHDVVLDFAKRMTTAEPPEPERRRKLNIQAQSRKLKAESKGHWSLATSH